MTGADLTDADIADAGLGRDGGAATLAGRYNTSPTQRVRIAALDRGSGRRQIRAATWGLVPFWAKDPKIGQKMINARAESAATKPAYRNAVRSMRALVPMDGWYEWQKTIGPDGRATKRPHYMTPSDGGLLTAAGLYSWWDRGAGPPLLTCTIVTTAAVGPLRAIHDRMPLLLPTEARQQWLDPAASAAELLAAAPSAELVDALELRRIGRAVGSPGNEGVHLLERIG